MCLSSHRQLGEFSSYQLSVQSSVRMHHRCAARVLYAGHKEIHYENEKRKRTKKPIRIPKLSIFTDEELIHQLIMTNITENSNETEKLSFGQRASDAVAKFAGSWAFIFSFIAVMVGWMAVNVILGTKAFDAYPFILLNLVLSCIAAIQAPLIMMSQNRQEAKDRQRAENDFKVNLKSELIIDDLHKKMDLIIENQKKINHRLDMLEQTGKAIDTPKAGSPIHNA